MNPWLKIAISAALIALISEIAKHSPRLGGLIAALPLVTVLTLIWLHAEQQPVETLSNHAFYTFWYVLASLPMFLALPYLLPRMNFWLALVLSMAVGLLGIVALAWVLRRLGMHLLD
ncbi:MAG: DUF3147 family protein [Formosimonas sp.]